MIFNKTYKVKKEKELIDLSLSELLDRYCGTNYVKIIFNKNGDVSVWISDSLKKQEGEQ